MSENKRNTSKHKPYGTLAMVSFSISLITLVVFFLPKVLLASCVLGIVFSVLGINQSMDENGLSGGGTPLDLL